MKNHIITQVAQWFVRLTPIDKLLIASLAAVIYMGWRDIKRQVEFDAYRTKKENEIFEMTRKHTEERIEFYNHQIRGVDRRVQVYDSVMSENHLRMTQIPNK